MTLKKLFVSISDGQPTSGVQVKHTVCVPGGTTTLKASSFGSWPISTFADNKGPVSLRLAGPERSDRTAIVICKCCEAVNRFVMQSSPLLEQRRKFISGVPSRW